MKKILIITMALTITTVFSAEVPAETIMFGGDSDYYNPVFPNLADYSLKEESTDGVDSSDVKLSPTVWPFTRSKTSQAKPKSTRKAFFLSLLLPGLGETYVGSKRGILFLGVEALSWWMYITKTNEGKDLEEDYERFADMYWHYFDTAKSNGDELMRQANNLSGVLDRFKENLKDGMKDTP